MTYGSFWTRQDICHALQELLLASATSPVTPTDALHVAKLSRKLNPMISICHFLLCITHGKILVWTLCLVFLELEMERISCLLWTVSLR